MVQQSLIDILIFYTNFSYKIFLIKIKMINVVTCRMNWCRCQKRLYYGYPIYWIGLPTLKTLTGIGEFWVCAMKTVFQVQSPKIVVQIQRILATQKRKNLLQTVYKNILNRHRMRYQEAIGEGCNCSCRDKRLSLGRRGLLKEGSRRGRNS